MRDLTAEERRAFLLAPSRTGILATTRPDGRPHAAPVWFDLDGDDPIFTTWHDTVKARNLAHDPRATLAVDDATFPFGFVVLEGRAEVADDLDRLRAWTTRIAARYVPAGQAEVFGARNAVPGELLVRLRVRRVVAKAGIAD